MTSTFGLQYQLCHNNAEYEFRDSENLKHFYCNKCNEFVISDYSDRFAYFKIGGFKFEVQLL